MAALPIHAHDVVRGLSQNWGWIFLRGVLAMIFGILALRHPLVAGLTLTLLSAVFGALLVVFSLKVRSPGTGSRE